MDIKRRWRNPLIPAVIAAVLVVLLQGFLATRSSQALAPSTTRNSSAATSITLEVVSSLALSDDGTAISSAPVVRIEGPRPGMVSYLVIDG